MRRSRTWSTGVASQTASATHDIADQINEIKAAAASAFNSAKNLSVGVHEMNGRTMAIAQSVHEQDRATRTIHENMARVATTVQSMTSLTNNVRRSAEGTLKVSSDVYQATDELQNRTTDLETSIHKLLQRIASA